MSNGQARPTRWIGHVDMDSFFASVEIRDDPRLKGLPVVVGGPTDKRGVVAAASYEARKYGIHSAMPMARASKLCPDLVRISPHGTRYRDASEQIFEILRGFSPLLEPLSLDEAFIDLTGAERLLGTPETIGRDIRSRIMETTSLTASVGIAPNKFIAKLASDHDKPDGLVIVTADTAVEFVQALPIERMWGVGVKTRESMKKNGVTTIGDLARMGPARVKEVFGLGMLKMYELAWARDERPVVPDHDARQVSHELTFARNQSSNDVLRGVMLGLCEQVAARLRKNNFRGRTVTVKLRFSDFKTITRRNTLGHFTDDSRTVYDEAVALLADGRTVSPLPIRLVGVGVSGLSEPDQIPLSLFDTPEADNRSAKLTSALDRVKSRFGSGSVRRAGTLVADKIQKTESSLNQED